MPQQANTANPKRIIAIDTLRGFALLGILLMNRPYSDLISYSCNHRLVDSVLPVVKIKSV